MSRTTASELWAALRPLCKDLTAADGSPIDSVESLFAAAKAKEIRIVASEKRLQKKFAEQLNLCGVMEL